MRSFDIYDFNLFDKFHTRVINWLDASLLILLGPSLIFSLTVRGNKFWRISALIRGIGRGPHEGPESRKCAEQAIRVGRKLFRMASTVIMSIIIYFYFATFSQQGVRQRTTTCVCAGVEKGAGLVVALCAVSSFIKYIDSLLLITVSKVIFYLQSLQMMLCPFLSIRHPLGLINLNVSSLFIASIYQICLKKSNW